MNSIKNILRLALLGSIIASFGALTSCSCSGDPDPVPQPTYEEPTK